MHATDTIPTPAIKRKKSDSLRRYHDGPQPPATIQHDLEARAYARGSSDTLRAVMLAAQKLLDKRECQS